MEQMLIFLTEYANEITAAAFSAVILLLLVVLHRIKRIGIQIESLAARMRQPEKEHEAKAVLEESVQNAEAVNRSAEEKADTPEELLDAVLGEVFS